MAYLLEFRSKAAQAQTYEEEQELQDRGPREFEIESSHYCHHSHLDACIGYISKPSQVAFVT